jgi:hypothetical protein
MATRKKACRTKSRAPARGCAFQARLPNHLEFRENWFVSPCSPNDVITGSGHKVFEDIPSELARHVVALQNDWLKNRAQQEMERVARIEREAGMEERRFGPSTPSVLIRKY